MSIIAVLSNSGNVGKTTLTTNLLLPRIANCELVKIETINDDRGAVGVKYSGKEFDSIIEHFYDSENMILDIGSSNIADFLRNIELSDSAHDDIDYFIIPVTPEEKNQIDTSSTVMSLVELGVDTDKIRIILNKVRPKTEKISIESQFQKLIDSDICNDLSIDFKSIPQVEETKAFDLMNTVRKTIEDCLNDDTDYKATLKSLAGKKDITSLEQKSTATVLQQANRVVKKFNIQLNDAFEKLNIDID